MSDYCLNCGAELIDGAEFCEECGHRVIKFGKEKTFVEIEKEIEEKVDAEFKKKKLYEYAKQREKELWAEKEKALRAEKEQERLKEQAERDAAERLRLEQIEQDKEKEREKALKIKKQEQEQRQKRRREQKDQFYLVLQKKKTQQILSVSLVIILLVLIVPYSVDQIMTMQENQRIAEEAERLADENRRIAEEIALDKATSEQLWVKTFGGPDSYYQDFGHCLGATSDGGYILTGGVASHNGGPNAAWLIKTDANGNEQWNKTYGGTSFSAGFSVSQTKDSGYIIIGWTRTITGHANAWLIKTDANGNEQWNKTYGGLSQSYAFDGCQTLDGGYIITGNDGSNMLFIKTDENGNEQWNKTFGAGIGYSVQQTTDGGYIIVGRNVSRGGSYPTKDFPVWKGGWLIKTDASGNKQWDRTFENETFSVVKQTVDGGYIIAGTTDVWIQNNNNYRTEQRISLIKTDNQGNKQWQYKQEEGSYSHGKTVIQTSDLGYIVAGYSSFIKIDENGNKKWNQTFSPQLGINTVLLTANEGYIISGNYDNDIYLIKTVGKQ